MKAVKHTVPPKLLRNFGNVDIYLRALGSAAYQLEWKSKMTETTTIFSKLEKGRFLVCKQWAKSKKLPHTSCDFDNRKAAIMHFMNNVDIIKLPAERVQEAKAFCLSIFTSNEKLEPISNPNFPRLRLQGAIGRPVEVRSRTGSEIIGGGVLLQLVGGEAELKITERHTLVNPNIIQKFDTTRVFIK